VPRSIGFAHIVRHDDGTSTGVWGPFTLHTAFQPIFAFTDGKLVAAAFEGLVRPFREHEPLAPSVFFGMLPAIDKLHVETLTRTLHLLNAATFLPEDAWIFINFDPSLFVDRAVVDAALREMRIVLQEAGIGPHRIVCEVTEQKSASQETLLLFVEALRANGFRIAVDDYGAEDSDINRVKELRPDIVKFDAHWITQLMASGPGLGLLTAMVDMFAAQGIATVFEGIEENWQLELAERSGASMLQGYALARPEIVPTSFSVFRPLAYAEPETDAAPEMSVAPAPGKSGRAARTFGRRTVQ
jgi:EAL domain-containing protein (putative c-di-GMP-specific phosphodiesterase class I)